MYEKLNRAQCEPKSELVGSNHVLKISHSNVVEVPHNEQSEGLLLEVVFPQLHFTMNWNDFRCFEDAHHQQAETHHELLQRLVKQGMQ